MTTTLSPLPVQRFYDNNNNPAIAGKLFTYQAGTTTKLTTYTDSTGGTPNSNPIILNFRGECNIWVNPNVAYKYVFAPANDTDPPTNPYWTVDNIVNSQLITLYGGVDTGIANAYVLNFTANFSALTDGIVIYWIPSHSNTAASTLNVNGLGVVNIVNQDGTALTGGEMAANQVVIVLYKGGQFQLVNPAFIQGTFTATLTGMTAVVTTTLYYKVVGKNVSIYAIGGAGGTSNSATFTITGMPASLAPFGAFGRKVLCCGVTDNGNELIAQAIISNFITFNLLTVAGANINGNGTFTAAGSKGITGAWNVVYSL